jgi:hypothetical protein
LNVGADPGGKKEFTKPSLTAKAGKATIKFSNPSQVPHALEIERYGQRETTETVAGRNAAPLTVELRKGEYSFYCPVDVTAPRACRASSKSCRRGICASVSRVSEVRTLLAAYRERRVSPVDILEALLAGIEADERTRTAATTAEAVTLHRAHQPRPLLLLDAPV